MKLTLLSDYSLRMLMHLAVNKDRLVTIAETAARYEISKNHLMKVAHQLGQHGCIETVRGRSGGPDAIRPPKQISLGDIVRHMEQGSILVDCFPGGKGGCLITPACQLKSILHEAQQAFFAVLDKFSLADLTTGQQDLQKLLLEAQPS